MYLLLCLCRSVVLELISTFAEAANEDLLDMFFEFIKASLLVLFYYFCFYHLRGLTAGLHSFFTLLYLLHRTAAGLVTAKLSLH
jgi:hypothetical protein